MRFMDYFRHQYHNKKHGQNAPVGSLNPRLLLSEDMPFVMREAYRAARTNLSYLKTVDGCQTVAITSSVPGEGKTTTSINMAIAMAMNGQKTLLIDADIRKPKIHRLLAVPAKTGLTEFLAAIDKKPMLCATRYPNLYLMPAGYASPNPAELLASERMKLLMEVLREQFDVILVDTPPLGLVTDAAVLRGVVDGFLIIVRSGALQRKVVENTVDALRRVHANILGFVLTQYSRKNDQYGDYNSYRAYEKEYQ